MGIPLTNSTIGFHHFSLVPNLIGHNKIIVPDVFKIYEMDINIIPLCKWSWEASLSRKASFPKMGIGFIQVFEQFPLLT